MNDNDDGQMPCIEYRKTDGRYEFSEVHVTVRGPTLDECRKHLDEILEKANQ